MPSKYVYPTFVDSGICLWETGKQLSEMPSKYVYPTFVESSICLWETGKQLTLTQFEDQMDKEQDVTWEKVPASTLMKNSIMSPH